MDHCGSSHLICLELDRNMPLKALFFPLAVLSLPRIQLEVYVTLFAVVMVLSRSDIAHKFMFNGLG